MKFKPAILDKTLAGDLRRHLKNGSQKYSKLF